MRNIDKAISRIREITPEIALNAPKIGYEIARIVGFGCSTCPFSTDTVQRYIDGTGIMCKEGSRCEDGAIEFLKAEAEEETDE